MDELRGNGFRPKLESLASALFKPSDPGAVNVAMRRAFEIHIAPIGFKRMLTEAGINGSRLDENDFDAGDRKLEAE
jgi:hypothetical protein